MIFRRIGHFKRINPEPRKSSRESREARKRGFDDDSASNSESPRTNKISEKGRASARKNILVNGVMVNMLVDTSAEVSIITLETLKKLGLEDKTIAPSINMVACNQSQIRAVGEVTVHLEYNQDKIKVDILAVEKGNNLLGISDAIELKIVRFNKPKGNSNLTNKNLDTDSVDINVVKNYYYSIKLIIGSMPFLAKERGVPFGLKNEVEREINKMVEKRVLVPSYQADWVSPIVVVRKPIGKHRICGDFRKLNESIMEDKYPLPKIEDFLAELGSKNRYFAKLELESAYHQIPLREECQGLTTIITHLGTFKYTVMSFGLKMAPSAF